MEADRIRYLLASYFRVRLEKVRNSCTRVCVPCVTCICARTQIKRFVLYLLSEWGTCRHLLSSEERDFVQKYADLKGAHFSTTVLEALPPSHREIGDPELGTTDLVAWVAACMVNLQGMKWFGVNYWDLCQQHTPGRMGRFRDSLSLLSCCAVVLPCRCAGFLT